MMATQSGRPRDEKATTMSGKANNNEDNDMGLIGNEGSS